MNYVNVALALEREFGTDMETACLFAYTHDREDTRYLQILHLSSKLGFLVFKLRKTELDKQINQHLKSGWTVERLTLVEKNLLRLGIFEITSIWYTSASSSQWNHWTR